MFQSYILASASPRRKELLSRIGFEFTVIPSTVEEKITKTLPSEVVCELAKQKAEDVFQSYGNSNTLVIGADTVVAYENEILGKPADEDDALGMLSMLSDRTHQVYTGVALIYYKDGQKISRTFCEKTDVTFYPINREDLLRYIATKDPMDKAGSYGIQGDFSIHVKEIHGDYNNVVGLPLSRLYQEIKELTSIPESSGKIYIFE